ncbi:hypothetical protein [Sphingobium sp. EM0848]|uniref:hypothetical protein n=1 Tax=Sphingobium sp. EM0848 TaxID=2743473 RepID=UPI00159C77B6|nr:hypothetical protein [Sphingobium sp. EM0848]
MRLAGIIIMGALALGGCAPRQDDPSNPPRLGQWHDRTVLTGVRLNDRALKEEEIPPDFRRKLARFDKDDSYCGEPRPRERAEVQALLDEKFDSCEIETFDLNGPEIAVLSRCRPRRVKEDVLMTAKVNGFTGAESIRLDIDAIARLTEKTGGNQLLMISGRRELTRTGDC